MTHHRTKIGLISIILTAIVAGCLGDDIDPDGSIGQPYLGIAIDRTSCTCSRGGLSVTCDVVDPPPDHTTCSIAYAATQGAGLFKTVDGGNSWDIQPTLIDLYLNAIAIDIHPDTVSPVVYVATEDSGVKATRDGGRTWLNDSGASLDVSIQDLVIDPNGCQGDPPCKGIFAATEFGIWRKTATVLDWEKMTTNGMSEQAIKSVALEYTNRFPSAVYAGAEGGHVYRFDPNLGDSWLEGGTASSPLPEEVISLAVHPLAPQIVYAGLGGGEGGGIGGIRRSNNRGISWETVSMLNPSPDSVWVLSFMVRAKAANLFEAILYAGVSGLQRCNHTETDCSATSNWTRLNVPTNRGVSSFAVDPYAGTMLLAGNFIGELFRSLDGGSTWEKVRVGR